MISKADASLSGWISLDTVSSLRILIFPLEGQVDWPELSGDPI
jgi:hypothetical protein